VATTVADADALLATVTDELTVDVEHTGYPIGHRDYALRTVQLGTEAFAVDLDPTTPSRPTSYAATLPGCRCCTPTRLPPT
jgi:hypothetical protein